MIYIIIFIKDFSEMCFELLLFCFCIVDFKTDLNKDECFYYRSVRELVSELG